MIKTKYSPAAAWLRFVLNINPSQLQPLSAGGGGNAWVHYNHPQTGIIAMHPHDIVVKGKVLYGYGFEDDDFLAFMGGYLGEIPRLDISLERLKRMCFEGVKSFNELELCAQSSP